MKNILFLVFFSLSLYSLDFKVASYNVENLFDLENDGTEYKEYKPNTKYWNQRAFNNKVKSISRVLNDIDADIISLQEVESQKALDSLLKYTKYKYTKFLKNSSSSIGLALLSKYPIIKSNRIVVNRYNKYSRDILKATVLIDKKELIIYTNHWRSKRAKESKRIIYATALKKDIDKLSKKDEYIILGDLNSNYDEYISFKRDKKLNDTYGITGINQVLNTTNHGNFIKKIDLLKSNKILHYNLWLDLDKQHRFSTIFKKEYGTPDNILLPKTLFDTSGISYINNSFNVYKAKYLFHNNKIKRWNKYKSYGYSDHLPIYAYFSTDKHFVPSENRINIDNKSYSIGDLYTLERLNKSVLLKDVKVIYKTNKMAIIKQSNEDRAIMIYKPLYDLKLGYSYDMSIKQIDSFYGLKEIVDIEFIKELDYNKNYKSLFINKEIKKIFELKNQNEIISNIEGFYNDGFLYFDDKKRVKIYFKKSVKKIKNNSKVKINTAQIGIFKSKVQLVINKESDFSIQR